MSRTKEAPIAQAADAPAATEGLDSLDSLYGPADPDVVIDAPAPAQPRPFEPTAERLKKIHKDLLKMHKQDPSKRTFAKEFCVGLAESIKSDGLLHPPHVISNGDGTYTVKSGIHRIYACCKILGWTEVPCFVFEEDEHDLSDAIEIAANLFANPLNEPQTRIAVTRWREIFLARKGDTKTARGTKAKYDGFAKEVEQNLGVSSGQAHRIAKTAKMIPVEDQKALTDAGVPVSKVDQMAAIGDAEGVKTASNLAAAGMDPDEAIRQGKKVKAEKKAAKKAPKADGEAPSKPEPVKKADLTDDEWLETYCGKILAALPFKTAFRRDAILYRRSLDKIVSLRTGTKKALAEAKKPGENGAFFANLFRLVRASHPMNWLVCDGCNGNGHVADDKTRQCSKCLGGGYKLKFEET